MDVLTAAMLAVEERLEELRGAPGAPGKAGTRGRDGRDGAGLNWRGAWASGTVYDSGDVVESDGSAYICTATTAGKPPGEGWDLLVSKGTGPGPVYIPRGGGGGSQTAAQVAFTPTGTIAATNVQAAIAEVASEAGGGTPTLAEVLAEGNEVGATQNPALKIADSDLGNTGGRLVLDEPYDPEVGEGNTGGAGSIVVAGGDGLATVDDNGSDGGTATLTGGISFDGALSSAPGRVDAAGGQVDGTGGTTYLYSGDAKLGSDAQGGDLRLAIGAGDGAGRDGLIRILGAGLPTSNPAVAGALWSNAGVVMVSSG